MFRFFTAVLRLSRPLSTASILLIAFTGSFVSTRENNHWQNIVLSLLSIGSIAVAGFIWNDIRDIATDIINKPKRPLPKGLISIKSAWNVSWLFTAIGIGCSLLLPRINLYISLMMIVLLWEYSRWMKGTPLVGNLAVAFATTIGLFFGGYAVAGDIQSCVWIGVVVFCTVLAREILKDLSDIEGDKAANYSTMATKIPFWISHILIDSSIVISLTVAVLGIDQMGNLYTLSTTIVAIMMILVIIATAVIKSGPRLEILSLLMKLSALIWFAGVISGTLR